MTGLVVGLAVLTALVLGARASPRGRLERLVAPDGPPASAGTGRRWLLERVHGLRRRVAPSAGEEGTAGAVGQLATLLRAGLDPASAWSHLVAASGPGPGGAWQAAAGAAAVASPVAPALRSRLRDVPAQEVPAVASVAAAVDVCERTGAAASSVLLQLADGLRQAADSDDARRSALAAPTATARLLLALPAVGLLLGQAVGASPLVVLTGTGVGRVCAVVGLLLAGAGWIWTRQLLRSAARTSPPATRRPRQAPPELR